MFIDSLKDTATATEEQRNAALMAAIKGFKVPENAYIAAYMALDSLDPD